MTPAELRAARAKLGLSQAQLGAVLGFTQSHVGHMERGDRDIQTVTAGYVNLLVKCKTPEN